MSGIIEPKMAAINAYAIAPVEVLITKYKR